MDTKKKLDEIGLSKGAALAAIEKEKARRGKLARPGAEKSADRVARIEAGKAQKAAADKAKP